MTKDNKVEINSMFHLVSAVYSEYFFKGKECPYYNLLEQINSYKLTNTDFDPLAHKIDDFMVDAYMVYEKYNQMVDKVDEILELIKSDKMDAIFSNMLKMFDINKVNDDDIKKEIEIISNTFEDLMFNFDYEGVHIRGIQKNFLQDKMTEAIENEDYEFCQEMLQRFPQILKDKINNLK